MPRGSSLSRISQKSYLPPASVVPSISSRLDHLSLGIIGVDSRPAVIIDVGTALTKIGYAGEFVPRAILRTELLHDCTGESIKVLDNTLDERDFYRRLAKFFRELFLNYYALCLLMIFRFALTTTKDRRVVIVESILARTPYRNLVARVLFENFDAPSILFAPSHLLATFPFGVSSALVIDVGYSNATVVPILDGVTMVFQLETSCVGAKYLEERVHELLRKYGKILTKLGMERPLIDSDDLLLKKERILEDIVVRFCFATKMDRGRLMQSAEYHGESELLAAPCDVRLPFGDEVLIVPGIVREWTAEVIFEENSDFKSLPQLVLDCVYRCPIDTRKKLLESMLLTGGTTRMQGFYARLQNEILRLVTTSDYANKLGHIGSVKFYRLPKSSVELYGSWIGGSMFGALEILQYRSLTRENWQACGDVPDWIVGVHEIDPKIFKSR
ncbi:unnamed protein product [Thelazia callipaeda]|uniref:Actin-related protein 10 n=1 Tax=Thelazia callipaeda TaxID=103827 RepID=A0A0N5CNW1_THECL|nr:unnamed protein product [Thelazia callipaeda]